MCRRGSSQSHVEVLLMTWSVCQLPFALPEHEWQNLVISRRRKLVSDWSTASMANLKSDAGIAVRFYVRLKGTPHPAYSTWLQREDYNARQLPPGQNFRGLVQNANGPMHTLPLVLPLTMQHLCAGICILQCAGRAIHIGITCSRSLS